jgi:tetratricopeptide (TPR) repeat protein
MPTHSAVPAIVGYVKELTHTLDLDRFRAAVRARYTEETLSRLLEQSTDYSTRFSVVFALQYVGTFACNGAVAGVLQDDDPKIRELAENALWAIWFRADTDENNAWLRRVAGLISSDELDRAVELATSLVEKAPSFAEAYNQRAIAYWMMKQWQESITDCKKVLELNPHHFGAMSGMGQCYVEVGDFEHAVEAFEKAIGMNRNLEHLQEVIDQLRRKMQS